ncbi:MAG: hypothetical protein WCE38_21965 [Burkholderiales bacterium]
MQKTRRKLIKGALAATVVTAAGCGGGGGSGGGGGNLPSGLGAGDPSTFAVPSQAQALGSLNACIVRSTREAEATQVQTLTQFDDTFLRGTLQVADGLVPTSGSGTVDGQFFLDGSKNWRQIVNGGTTSVATQWTELTAQPKTVQEMYALLAIDDSGNIIQTRLEGPEGSVATDSCWHSVSPAAGARIG